MRIREGVGWGASQWLIDYDIHAAGGPGDVVQCNRQKLHHDTGARQRLW